MAAAVFAPSFQWSPYTQQTEVSRYPPPQRGTSWLYPFAWTTSRLKTTTKSLDSPVRFELVSMNSLWELLLWLSFSMVSAASLQLKLTGTATVPLSQSALELRSTILIVGGYRWLAIMVEKKTSFYRWVSDDTLHSSSNQYSITQLKNNYKKFHVSFY